MTVSYIAYALMIGAVLTLVLAEAVGLTGTVWAIVGAAGAVGLAVLWAYLPLPRTNGSLGGPTERYWGWTNDE